MKEPLRRVVQVGAACAASIAGVTFGASASPQEVRAQGCERNYCQYITWPQLYACQPTNQDSGCDMTGPYSCGTYCCSGSCS